MIGQEHHLHEDERRERREHDGDEGDEAEKDGVDARALAFHSDQQLQEQRILDPRPVALPVRLVRQRRPQLLVELGGGAGEQRQHHQEIEMKDEIEQRRDHIEWQQRNLDVEDRQRLRLA